jgi:hypothetical protein
MLTPSISSRQHDQLSQGLRDICFGRRRRHALVLGCPGARSAQESVLGATSSKAVRWLTLPPLPPDRSDHDAAQPERNPDADADRRDRLQPRLHGARLGSVVRLVARPRRLHARHGQPGRPARRQGRRRQAQGEVSRAEARTRRLADFGAGPECDPLNRSGRPPYPPSETTI